MATKISRSDLDSTSDIGVAIPLEGLAAAIERFGMAEGIPVSCSVTEIKVSDGIVDSFTAKTENAVCISCKDGKYRPNMFLVQRALVGTKMALQIYVHRNGGPQLRMAESNYNNAGTVGRLLAKQALLKAQQVVAEEEYYLNLMYQTVIPNALNDPDLFNVPEPEPEPEFDPDPVPVSVLEPEEKPYRVPVQEEEEIPEAEDTPAPDEWEEEEKEPVDPPKPAEPPRPVEPPRPAEPSKPVDPPKPAEPPRRVETAKPVKPSSGPHKMSAAEVNERHYLLFITRAEASQGVTRTIELDGQEIDIDVPAGSKGDTVIVIPGKGYRDKETGYCGDLRVELMID